MALKATKEVKFRVQEIDFRAYQIIRIQELPGASPPGPPPGLCPGPATVLTQPPRPPPYFPLILQFAVGSQVILMRNSQDMDWWNIYLHFLGHVHLGDSTNKCACAKIKNRNIQNFGFYIELFHFLKHFRRLSFIFTSILSQCCKK